MIRILPLALLLLTVSAARAHDCSDSFTRELTDIWFATLMKYPSQPLSEQAIDNYQFIIQMGTRPEDKKIQYAACLTIMGILQENNLFDERASDYAQCSTEQVSQFLAGQRVDPNSFKRTEDYKPVVRVQPVYPRRALKKGISGHVVMSFTVTSEGRVKSPQIIETTDELFNAAALSAIKKFKYKPKLKNGVPIEVSSVQATINFNHGDATHPDHCK